MRIRYTIVLIAAMATLLCAGGDTAKRYDIRSGKILYEIKGSGNMMGMMQMRTKGKKRLIFDHYGNREITEIVKVTQETTGGRSKMKKEHTLVYLNGGVAYQVDFAHQRIVRMENPAQGMGALLGGGKSLTQTGEAMMRQMGGRKTGTDTVLGYRCDVWTVMGTTQCLYHGVALWVKSDIMGIKSSETAVEASFDIDLSPKSFKLPDYPITDVAGTPLHIDRSRLEQIDARTSRKQQKQMQEGAEALQAAFGAAAAHQNESQAAQEAAIANAMLPMMKRKFQQQKTELVHVRKCLEDANTLAQARQCNPHPEEGEARMQSWSRTEKAKVLKEINAAIGGMDCAMKARSMQDIEVCFSDER